MLRAVSSNLIKRAVTKAHYNHHGSKLPPLLVTPQAAAFHASPRWESEDATSDGTLVATSPRTSSGLAWFALPIGIVAAIPLINWEWIVLNEETQLAAVTIFFTIAMYTQAGDAIAKAFDDDSNNIIKEHNQVEAKVIAKYQEKLEFLRSVSGIAEGVQALTSLKEESVDMFNIVATNKPKHELKAQVERALAMIQQEEINTRERLKTSLMDEASTSVAKSFTTSQDLRKAALDVAIARIKGAKGEQKDPVQGSFVKFFKDKATTAAKGDTAAEAKTLRDTLLTKLNTLAENEGFYFNFDKATSQPKLSS